jgi:hypothetical protein
VFPVGSATSSYTPVTITNAGITDQFSVNVKTGFDQPVPDEARAVSRQWTITESLAGGSDATLSLAWTASEQGAAFDPSAPVSIIRYDGNLWENYPATVTGTGTASSPYVATASGITAFSLFGVINSSATLPSELISFKAVYKNNEVQISWTTANEMNTAQFRVERSADSRSFTGIGVVNAANQTGTQRYQFTDLTPLERPGYYRLEMVDKDGSVSYSLVVAVNTGAILSLRVYPNPVKEQLQVQHSATKGNGIIEIYSAQGKMILEKRLLANLRHTYINLSTLLPGTYLLRYLNGAEQETVHFTKQ